MYLYSLIIYMYIHFPFHFVGVHLFHPDKIQSNLVNSNFENKLPPKLEVLMWSHLNFGNLSLISKLEDIF